jgi:beta-lactamase class A
VNAASLRPLAVLERRLTALARSVQAEWGIYLRFLDNDDEIAIEADRPMDTMSLIKVPILVALMQRVDRGEVSLDQRLTLSDDHKRLGTGVMRLFAAGATFTLRDMVWMMEVVSDNTATDLCLAAAGGVEAVNASMRSLGIEGITMTGTALDWFRALAGSMDPALAAVPPGELARRGYPFTQPDQLSDARARYHFGGGQPFSLATARALGTLLASIQAGTCASPAACAFMREVLSGQQLRNLIPRFVWGASFAHKTGGFEPFIGSDIGIVTPYRGAPVVMCFLSQRHAGLQSWRDDAVGRMAELAIFEAEARGR